MLDLVRLDLIRLGKVSLEQVILGKFSHYRLTHVYCISQIVFNNMEIQTWMFIYTTKTWNYISYVIYLSYFYCTLFVQSWSPALFINMEIQIQIDISQELACNYFSCVIYALIFLLYQFYCHFVRCANQRRVLYVSGWDRKHRRASRRRGRRFYVREFASA